MCKCSRRSGNKIPTNTAYHRTFGVRILVWSVPAKKKSERKKRIQVAESQFIILMPLVAVYLMTPGNGWPFISVFTFGKEVLG